MKKKVYLICTVLLAASTFIVSPAMAQTSSCNDADPTSGPCTTPNTGASLPINSGVIYLLTAGFVIGVVAVKRKNIAIKA